MRILLFLIGFVLFAPMAEAALPVPETPFTISAYPQEVFAHVDNYLSQASVGAATACSGEESAAAAADSLRDILLDLEGSVIEAQRDIKRTACYRHDIVAMEKYLRALIDWVISSAEECQGEMQSHYESMVVYVWNRLLNLRQFGLDPTVQAPAYGEEEPTIGTGPSLHLCPYDSVYASPSFGGVGCRGIVASTITSVEINLLESIIARLGAIGTVQLPGLRMQLMRIWVGAEEFVSGVSRRRFLEPSVFGRFEPDLTSGVPVPTAGEAGCLGWPANTPARIVTGEDIPLQNYFPFVLTNEMADTLAYLEVRDDPRWSEYERALQKDLEKDEGGALTFIAQGEGLRKTNRDHLDLESFSILSIRDAQLRVNDLANTLHASTRSFVRQAVILPDDSDPLPSPTPLRTFARRYAMFLSRMCVNKGCENTLLRTIELSLRDECFSSFLMGAFFQANPSASTLPACRALYVD